MSEDAAVNTLEEKVDLPEPVVETPSMPQFEESYHGIEADLEPEPKVESPPDKEKAGKPSDTIKTQHDKAVREYVPLKKYVALEKQFKGQRQYLENMESRIQERLSEAVQAALSQKSAPPPPDKHEDPQAWMVHQEEQRQVRERQESTQRQQQQQQRQEQEELLTYARSSAETWKQDHPDYPERLKLLQDRFYESAVEEGLTDAQAHARGSEMAYEVIRFSKKFNLNPAMFYHTLADVYAGNTDNLEDQIRLTEVEKIGDAVSTAVAGAKASKTLGGNAGGGAKTDLTYKDIANMDDGEAKFEAMNRRIAKDLGLPYYK